MDQPETAQIDVLVPTKDRPTELATTLAGLAAQSGVRFRVVVSDQSEGPASYTTPAAQTLVRALRRRGTDVELCRHLPRRGMADTGLPPLPGGGARGALPRRRRVARSRGAPSPARCAPHVGVRVRRRRHAGALPPRRPTARGMRGPSRSGPAGWEPETIEEGRPRLGLGGRGQRRQRGAPGGVCSDSTSAPSPRPGTLYAVTRSHGAAGCVLFDRSALLDAGGFDFWQAVPADAHGEDVLAQLRVMARHGGAGILPSGAYHQQAPINHPEPLHVRGRRPVPGRPDLIFS